MNHQNGIFSNHPEVFHHGKLLAHPTHFRESLFINFSNHLEAVNPIHFTERELTQLDKCR